jgi:RHS repeat-associated protein
MGYTLNGETQYVYDGWRVIQERNSSGTPVVSYTRGTDLSGSMEGAGGIGGLLARSHGYSAGNWSTHSYYHADGNGNITYLLNAGQSMVANYKYDAYGNTLASSGSLAGANNYRFSSKERISVQDIYGSELYYYGYRFYQPSLQRWLTRDPLDELGFDLILVISMEMSVANAGDPTPPDAYMVELFNQYAFVLNSPTATVDVFGLKGSKWLPWNWPIWPPYHLPFGKPKPPKLPPPFEPPAPDPGPRKYFPPYPISPRCRITTVPDWVNPDPRDDPGTWPPARRHGGARGGGIEIDF